MGTPLKPARTVDKSCTVKVGVVVPVYNVRSYLEQCVESLVAQTVPPSMIVLVDDGSTDGSGEMCDKLAHEHASVQVVHKENAGLGYARNTGLNSMGNEIDYVMFVDSDDWLELGAVEWLLAAAKDIDADCVIGGHTKKTADGKSVFELRLENALYQGAEIRDELLPRLCGSAPRLSDSMPMSVCSSLFRASCIRRHGLRFPSEREVISEDFVFKFNFLLHAQNVVISDFVGYCYRTSNASLTTSYRNDRFEACLRFHQEAMRMVADAGISDKCITRLQKTFLINLRMCIDQEVPRVSGKQKRIAIQRIRQILSDFELREIFEEYPVNELRWRQRLFVELAEHQAAGLLFKLAEMGIA